MSIFRKMVFAVACLALFAVGARASAANVYIAQNATGAANGADCADAKPVSFFNTAGNWGSGSAQIGPGTTVHLCGTFTVPVGGFGLTVQGSGSSGNPITVLMESGAIITSPAMLTGIYCNNQNYVTVDGGTNGLIQNTDNGTLQTYQNPGVAVDFEGCDYGEVRHVNVQNIFVKANNGSDGQSDFCINVHYIPTSSSIHDNTCTWANHGIDINYVNRASNINIYNNSINNIAGGIWIGDASGGSSSASGINVSGNNIGPNFDVYLDGAQQIHGDGIVLNACCNNSGGTMSNFKVYNNYVHGDLSYNYALNSTGYITLFGWFSNGYIFNNVIGQDVTQSGGGAPEGIIRLSAGGAGDNGSQITNLLIANNTIFCQTTCSQGIKADPTNAGAINVENNVFTGLYFDINANNGSGFARFGIINNNVHYNYQNIGTANGGIMVPSLLTWQTTYRYDTSGIAGNPMLSSNFIPQSAAIGMGTNLTGLGISQLDSDKAGTPRPATGAWVAGAYQTGTASPASPSGLTAIVQ